MAEPISPEDFPGAGCAHVRVANARTAMRAELVDNAALLAAIKTAVETRLGRSLTARQFMRLMGTTLAEWMERN